MNVSFEQYTMLQVDCETFWKCVSIASNQRFTLFHLLFVEHSKCWWAVLKCKHKMDRAYSQKCDSARRRHSIQHNAQYQSHLNTETLYIVLFFLRWKWLFLFLCVPSLILGFVLSFIKFILILNCSILIANYHCLSSFDHKLSIKRHQLKEIFHSWP